MVGVQHGFGFWWRRIDQNFQKFEQEGKTRSPGHQNHVDEEKSSYELITDTLASHNQEWILFGDDWPSLPLLMAFRRESQPHRANVFS